jgi:hypothetical protein
LKLFNTRDNFSKSAGQTNECQNLGLRLCSRNENESSGILNLLNYLDFKKCIDVILSVKSLQNPVTVPGIEIERTQDFPTSEVVDYFDKRFFAVTFYKSQFHASLINETTT